jgi:hypothetical protein
MQLMPATAKRLGVTDRCNLDQNVSGGVRYLAWLMRRLNQPLSADLMRERVSNNVGEAGDEEVSRLAITQHIAVTISADTPICVVLEQPPKPLIRVPCNQVHGVFQHPTQPMLSNSANYCSSSKS